MEPEKDFDRWNTRKKKIHNAPFRSYVHEREVWWCALGLNIGFEQDGKNDLFERPVLVLRKFSADVVLAVPLTSRERKGLYYLTVPYDGQKASLILSQLRLISTKRLLRRMYRMSGTHFKEAQDAICAMITKRPPRKRGPQGPQGHL
jgi:mRNA interferase MazF